MKVALLLLPLCLVAGAARAQNAPEAEFFDRWARQLYDKGRAQAALPLFLRSHRAAPTHRGLFNIALVAEVAEQPLLAYAFYDAYLDSEDDDPARRAAAVRKREALGQAFARVRVTSAPEGAEIFVDSEDLGSRGHTPRTLALRPGVHRIMLVLPEHERVERSLTIERGRSVELEARLPRLEGRLALTTEPPGAVVTVQNPTYTFTATAGRTLDLPVGSYRLHLSTPSGAEGEATVTISPGRLERRSEGGRAARVEHRHRAYRRGADGEPEALSGGPSRMQAARRSGCGRPRRARGAACPRRRACRAGRCRPTRRRSVASLRVAPVGWRGSPAQTGPAGSTPHG